MQLQESSSSTSMSSDLLLDSESRELLIASRRYAGENRRTSWWHLLTTLTLVFALIGIVACAPGMLMSAACSLLIGLTLVRMFILYHDYLHQTIFKGSFVAGAILKVYGHLMLTPPAVWKRTHDHHHRHNSKIFGASIGSFPVMTTTRYSTSSWLERFEYRLARSTWVIVFGYLTVFLFGMCISPLMTDFRRNLQVIGTLCIHFGTIAVSLVFMGLSFTAFALVIPTVMAMLVGAYLFYVQHNFPEAKVRSPQAWTYSDAALTASSYLQTGPVLRWFTGNIGFHHVHHLNAKIPFYRLPEAMAGLKGLQFPGRTTLAIRDILACLKLKLWDADLGKFVPFNEAKSSIAKSQIAQF